MANRHLSRSIVLQTLFEWDVQQETKTPELHEILERNISEFAPDANDMVFMKGLLDGVVAKKNEIDAVIVKAAPEWPIEKISTIDRNILRIGLFELLFGDRKEVPAKVAINEAIELGKNFGGDSSGRFINGVLGAVYKDIGEPGKNEQSKKGKKSGQLEKKALCGAVVYAHTDEGLKLAFVHDVFGHWTLSKARKDSCEVEEGCAERAIKEEMGLETKAVEKIGENEYVASDPELGKVIKCVMYYLAEAQYGEIKLGKKEGLDDAKWFGLDEVDSLNLYDDIRPIVERGLELISSKMKVS